MSDGTIEAAIDRAWEERARIGPDTEGEAREAVEAALEALDRGEARVAEKRDGAWRVHQWCKKAVLLSFRLAESAPVAGGPDGAPWYDKVPSKFEGWDSARFAAAGFRAVPELRGPAVGLYRPRRRADALLRECRRPGRREHDDRHLVHRRLLRAGGRQLPYLRRRRAGRRAGAAPGRAGDRRGQLLHRRAQRGGGGRGRRRGRGARHGRLHLRDHEDRGPRHRRDAYRPGAALCRRRAGKPAGPAPARRPAGAEPLLRRHRQDGGCADPAPRRRSTSCCATDAGGRPRPRPRPDPLPERHAGRCGRAGCAGRRAAAARLRLRTHEVQHRRHAGCGQSLRPARQRRAAVLLRRAYRCGARRRRRGLERAALLGNRVGRAADRARRGRHEGRDRRLRRGRLAPRPGSRLDRAADHRRRGGPGGQRHPADAGAAGGAGRAPRRLRGRRADQSRRASARRSRSAGAAR